MRLYLPILVLAVPVWGAEIRSAEIHELLKSADIEATLAKTQGSLDVIMKPNFALVFRAVVGKGGGWQAHPDADEVWLIRKGSAKVSLGESASSAKHYDLSAGDLVSTARTEGYEIDPGEGRFEYVVIRTFPTQRHLRGAEPAGQGGRGAPAPLAPDVVIPKGKIDGLVADNNKNQPMLSSRGAFSMNMPIYAGAPGPYEKHAAYDQIYFVRFGSAKAKLDGYILNPTEPQFGEIRGTGVLGAREYTLAPGDILFVPRNTSHFMDPGNLKFAYLLAHIRD